MQFLQIILRCVCAGLLFGGDAMVTSVFGEEPRSVVLPDLDLFGRTAVIQTLPARSVKSVGTCRIGQEFRVKIDLKNALGSQLNLRAIDPDCGCLAVVPEQRQIASGGMMTLSLRLAPSSKIATVRRSIRIYFEESTHPLVLDVDVRVSGPLRLSRPAVQLADPSASFTVAGAFEEVGGQIQKVESLRGSFVISDSVVQDAEGFKFSARPTFSFGGIDDLVRIHYRNPMGQIQVIDLPLRLRFNTPLRFLPSTLQLELQDSDWVGTTRMIAVPGKLRFPLNQLRYMAVSRSESGKSSHELAVRVENMSSVVSVMEVVLEKGSQIADRDNGMFPDRLLVYGPEKEVVGILNLVRLGDN